MFKYTTTWMDTLRNGSFGLSNTNKLLKTYNGANGLKTGSTSKAKYCLAASAERDGMELIAVVLGAPSTAERFGSAAKLLDYGFANYSVVKGDELVGSIPNLPVQSGTADTVPVALEGNPNYIVKKGNADKVDKEINTNTICMAPIKKGDVVGQVVFRIDGEKIGENNIVAIADVDRIGFFDLFIKNMKKYFSM